MRLAQGARGDYATDAAELCVCRTDGEEQAQGCARSILPQVENFRVVYGRAVTG